MAVAAAYDEAILHFCLLLPMTNEAMTDAIDSSTFSEAQAHAHTGDERWQSFLAVQIVMIVLATAAVVLRFTARRIGPRELWWDDWVILAALVRNILCCV